MERKKVRAKVEVIIYDNQYLVFQASDNETVLDENSLMQYDIKNIVFSDLNDKDVEWLDIVFDYIQQRDHMSVYFMGHSISKKVLSEIDKRRQNSGSTTFHFSVNIATINELNDNDYISCFTYLMEDWTIVPFNLGTLQYSSFKTIVSEATKLSSLVRNNTSGDLLERIIFIDNWIQANIQYIKCGSFQVYHQKYIYQEIKKAAIVPDVLCNHYGTCEDIAATIVAILSILGIESDVIAANGHAWVTIEYDGLLYIWDCTYNITRNPNKIKNELKAKKYSYEHTLIGYSTEKVYCKFGPFKKEVSSVSYKEETIEKAISKMVYERKISFSYSDTPKYKSQQ